MERHPWRRLLAWLIDWLCILVWVGVVAAVGVPLQLAGLTSGLSTFALNLVAALLVVVPVTLALAALESSRLRATPGKLAVRLRVVRTGTERAPGFGRALARNAMKVALPWTIGHAAVYAIVGASGGVPVWVWLLTGCAYALPAVWVVSLFVGSGRTPYDRAAGTVVIRRGRGEAASLRS